MTRTDVPLSGASNGGPDGMVETIVPLEKSLSAESALKRIHLELARRIEANREGVRQGLPGEYLHDFRVAVRRTRTGLRQLKHVYPRPPADRFADDFQWLSKTTGTARDLEVYLRSFDAVGAELGAATVESLAPFIAFLREHEEVERRGCAEAIASARYRRLTDDWREFLTLPGGAADGGRDAARAVREVAAERIEAAYARVVRRSGGLHVDGPAEAFHRLRLDCKKLRYLLEFFSVLFDGDEGTRAVVALKQTQDSLGAINDLRVQADWLARYDGPATGATDSFGAYLCAHQRRERAEFLQRFAAFTGAGTAATLRSFLRTEARPH